MQVSRVSAPWLRTIVLDDTDDGNYVIPNIESVVVGGTHQTGHWDTVISYCIKCLIHNANLPLCCKQVYFRYCLFYACKIFELNS